VRYMYSARLFLHRAPHETLTIGLRSRTGARRQFHEGEVRHPA
jgi:hypothetical protein